MGNKEKVNEEGEMVMMTKVYFHVGIQGPCKHRPVSALIFIVEGRNITDLPLQLAGTASCTSCLNMKTTKGNHKQENALTMYSVIHKSLRDFRTRLRNNQDRHGRKEHINR